MEKLSAVVSAIPSSAFEHIIPAQAYGLAVAYPDVYILDVRTPEEWKWVGHPGENRIGEGSELDGKVVNVPYLVQYRDRMIVNTMFVSDVKEYFEGKPDVVLITMCRNGNRSLAAAAELEDAGFRAINMLAGFEGNKDARGYRMVNGWINDGLPYHFGDGAHVN
jgi:rhodanese-related sulfurtransferase